MDGRIRVCRIIARLNVGGPARHVAHLAAGLGEPFDTTLIAGSLGPGEADMAPMVEAMGVTVHTLPRLGRELRPGNDAVTLASLTRLLRRRRPHIVHTHTAKAGAIGRVAARLAGVPIRIHTYHGHVLGGGYFSSRKTEFFRRVERRLARQSQRLVVLTESQAEELSSVHRVAERDRFQVIPLGLDLAPLRQLAPEPDQSARQQLGLPADVPIVGVVGRLVPIKRHDLLIEALGRIPVEAEESPIHLAVIGGGERESALVSKAKSLGLGDRVHWLGWRDDLSTTLSALDAVALSSDDEGTPVALLEAVAAGRPIVSTAVGGVGEVFRGKAYANLTPPSDADALARAIRDVIKTGLKPSDGERDEVVRRFAVDRLISDVRELYQEELSRAGYASLANQSREASPRLQKTTSTN